MPNTEKRMTKTKRERPDPRQITLDEAIEMVKTKRQFRCATTGRDLPSTCSGLIEDCFGCDHLRELVGGES